MNGTSEAPMVALKGRQWRDDNFRIRACSEANDGKGAAMPVTKVWAWLTRSPDIPEEYMARPTPDAELSSAMGAAADRLAARHHLDYTIESLDALDQNPAAGSTDEMGAYLGEVILRSAPAMHWGRDTHGEPGIALGAWLADPFSQVERIQSRRPSSSLSKYAADILLVSSADSVDEGCRSAGFLPKQATQGQELVESVRRRRRRKRRP